MPGPVLLTSTRPRAGVTSEPLAVQESGSRRSSLGLTLTLSCCLSQVTRKVSGREREPCFCIRVRIEYTAAAEALVECHWFPFRLKSSHCSIPGTRSSSGFSSARVRRKKACFSTESEYHIQEKRSGAQ